MTATTTSNSIGEAMQKTSAPAPCLADNPALLAWKLFVATAAMLMRVAFSAY